MTGLTTIRGGPLSRVITEIVTAIGIARETEIETGIATEIGTAIETENAIGTEIATVVTVIRGGRCPNNSVRSNIDKFNIGFSLLTLGLCIGSVSVQVSSWTPSGFRRGLRPPPQLWTWSGDVPPVRHVWSGSGTGTVPWRCWPWRGSGLCGVAIGHGP